MKGIDVLVVRFLPFLLYIIVCLEIICCWQGLDYYPFNMLHSNSALYAWAMFRISLANKKYHCVYNRAMYVFLIVIPIFNYLDGLFLFFEDVERYLWVVSTASIITAVATAFLAVKHFVQASKRRLEYGKQQI